MRIFLTLIITFLCVSCVTLRPVEFKNYDSITSYKYVYIHDVNSVTSTSVYSSGGYVYGSSQTINPKDIIAGKFMNQGLIIVNEVKDEANTLIVNYAQTGKRYVMGGLGYTMIINIQMINAKTHEPVFICSAEGIGSTEVEDITEAIDRCLGVLK